MKLYTFRLESFQINTTRSRGEDTDTITFGLQVGAQPFPIESYFAGKVDNGSHSLNLEFGPVLITEDSTKTAFTYLIYNGDAGSLSTSLVALGEQLLSESIALTARLGLDPGAAEAGEDVPNLDDPFDDTSDWSKIPVIGLVVALGELVFPNCDGFVAADGISLNKGQWDQSISSAGGTSFRKTMSYPGTNSPAGCGSNSAYTVTWSVTRETIIGSLRHTLKSHGIKPHPGLRSLAGP